MGLSAVAWGIICTVAASVLGIIGYFLKHTVAATNASSEQWDEVDPDKLLKNANALVRAAAYKRKTDLANKTGQEAALEANKGLLFDVLSKKYPDLYQEVMKAVKQEQTLLRETEDGL